jgi:uncharacterized protein YbjT (DUF2867 family)
VTPALAVEPPATLVCGATGSQGGAVVAALLASGRPVRALVRDAGADRARALADRGVTLLTGDLTDTGTVVSAMRGVGAAFGLTVGPDEVEQGLSIIAAAEQTSLPHLVLSSVASAEEAPQVPHFARKARIEAAARASPVATTVVAPTWFFDNILGATEALRSGELPLALPAGRTLQAVALIDLGRLVAELIAIGPVGGHRRIEVAADEVTPASMAADVAAILGVTIRPREVPLPQVAERSTDLAAMYAFLADTGYHVDIAALRAAYDAVGWHTFAQWVRLQRWS